ncbi:hypothetical protein H0H93_014331, partial [Arthromyces matolae]
VAEEYYTVCMFGTDADDAVQVLVPVNAGYTARNEASQLGVEEWVNMCTEADQIISVAMCSTDFICLDDGVTYTAWHHPEWLGCATEKENLSIKKTCGGTVYGNVVVVKQDGTPPHRITRDVTEQETDTIVNLIRSYKEEHAIADAVLQRLGFYEVTLLLATSWEMRAVVREGLKRRALSRLGSFLNDAQVIELWITLERLGGGVIGSLLWEVLSPNVVLSKIAVCQEMEVVIPRGKIDDLEHLLTVMGLRFLGHVEPEQAASTMVHQQSVWQTSTGQYMSPTFNADRARKNAAQLPNYVASPGFGDRVQWKKRGNANLLLECDRNTNDVTEAVCVIIGEVSDERLFTNPLGNYNPQFNKLATAKYQLSLTCPAEPVLADDFKNTLRNLSAIQDGVGAGLDNQYFLIRMDGSQTPNETLDEESASIVVDWNMKETVDMFKLTHKMLPLKVYGPDDEPIAPEEVTRTIRGAIVEMYFRLKHYYMGNGDTKYNCFSGIIEQIIVLRRAEHSTPSPFREAGRKGPFRPRLMDIAPMALLVKKVTEERKEKEVPADADVDDAKKKELSKEPGVNSDNALKRSAKSDSSKIDSKGTGKPVAEGAVNDGKDAAVVNVVALKPSANIVGEGDANEEKGAAPVEVDSAGASTGDKEVAGGAGGRQLRKGKNKASEEAGGDEKRRKEA